MTVHSKKPANSTALRFLGTCLCTGFVSVAVMAFPLKASAQSSALPDDQIQNRVQYLERQVQTLSRAVYRGEKPPAAADNAMGGDAQTMTQIEVRLSYLEEQIQHLTGRLEEYGYQIRTMENRIDTLEDQLKNRPVISPPAHTGTLPPRYGTAAPGAVGGHSGYGQEPYVSGNNNVTSDSRPPLVSPPTQPILTIPQHGGGTEVLNTMPPGAQALGVLRVTDNEATPQTAPQDTPEKAYESAFAQIRDHKYKEAATSFTQFLQQYPDHNLAANAQYWLSETFYVRGEYTEAARQFARGYQKYPKSTKTADNLLKLGLSLARSEKTQEACLTFTQLQQEFAGKADDIVSRSKQEQKRLGCE